MAEGQSGDKAPDGDDQPEDTAEATSEAESEDTSSETTETTENAETGDDAETSEDTESSEKAEADAKAESKADAKAEAPGKAPAAATPAPAPTPTGGGSAGSTPLVPVAIAAVVALVIGVVIGVVIGGSGDDDDEDADTVAAGAEGDAGEEHDHGDHGEEGESGDDEHAGHNMGDLSQFSEEDEENGLVQLLEDHHWHGPDDGLDDLSDEDQELLDYQLESLEYLAEDYPTVADADEDFKRAGPFIPGMGVHYISRDTGETITIPQEVGNDEDGVEVRPTLMFEGAEDDSELIGYMFLAVTPDAEEPPAAFVGAEGLWHQHTQMCIVTDEETGELDFPFVADQDGITDEICEGVGGEMHEIGSYMLHVWSVPGMESELGLYTEINPEYPCEDGTYHRTPYDELEPPYLSTCADA